MYKFICSGLLGLAILVGCASTRNYEAMLNTWVGSPEDALLQKWGPPSNVYQSGTAKYLTFAKSGSAYVPGTLPTYQTSVVGNTVYSTPVGGTAGYTVSKNCNTTFIVQNGRVVSWRWDGNACRM